MYSEVSVLSYPVIHPQRANHQAFGSRWAWQVQIGLWETGVFRLSIDGHTSGPYRCFSLEVRKYYFQGHKPWREGTFTRTRSANEKREGNVGLHHIFIDNFCFIINTKLTRFFLTSRLIHCKSLLYLPLPKIYLYQSLPMS